MAYPRKSSASVWSGERGNERGGGRREWRVRREEEEEEDGRRKRGFFFKQRKQKLFPPHLASAAACAAQTATKPRAWRRTSFFSSWRSRLRAWSAGAGARTGGAAAAALGLKKKSFRLLRLRLRCHRPSAAATPSRRGSPSPGLRRGTLPRTWSARRRRSRRYRLPTARSRAASFFLSIEERFFDR